MVSEPASDGASDVVIFSVPLFHLIYPQYFNFVDTASWVRAGVTMEHRVLLRMGELLHYLFHLDVTMERCVGGH